jgi:hypothetical protein
MMTASTKGRDPMTAIRYSHVGTYSTYEYDYEPKDYIGTLDWFIIERCARERMTENCGEMTRWRGERRSFYTSIMKMDADTKVLLD